MGRVINRERLNSLVTNKGNITTWHNTKPSHTTVKSCIWGDLRHKKKTAGAHVIQLVVEFVIGERGRATPVVINVPPGAVVPQVRVDVVPAVRVENDGEDCGSSRFHCGKS